MAKYLVESRWERKGLSWLTVSEGIVHLVGGSMVAGATLSIAVQM